MSRVECLNTGIIYRNPIPHIRSVHAYFPTVVQLSGEELLATMSLGEAFESADMHVNVFRSVDGGQTWKLEGPIYGGTKDRVTSEVGRLTKVDDDEVVFWMTRHDRSRQGMGLTNPETLGFAETE